MERFEGGLHDDVVERRPLSRSLGREAAGHEGEVVSVMSRRPSASAKPLYSSRGSGDPVTNTLLGPTMRMTSEGGVQPEARWIRRRQWMNAAGCHGRLRVTALRFNAADLVPSPIGCAVLARPLIARAGGRRPRRRAARALPVVLVPLRPRGR
jgi:hypothetical protein